MVEREVRRGAHRDGARRECEIHDISAHACGFTAAIIARLLIEGCRGEIYKTPSFTCGRVYILRSLLRTCAICVTAVGGTSMRARCNDGNV